MRVSFGKSILQAAQLLQFPTGCRCSSISSIARRNKVNLRLAERPSTRTNNEGYVSAICRLQTSPNPQDAQPKTLENSHKRKRKGKNSLRRVAVEAQRSQETSISEKPIAAINQPITKTVVAFCAAEQYDIAHVSRILNPFGHQQDPYGTKLYPQVVHVEIPVESPLSPKHDTVRAKGDLFVFPSGAVVGWGVPETVLSTLVTKTLLPAAERAHIEELEEEDLEFLEDPTREYSSIKGDTIILGTKTRAVRADAETSEPLVDDRNSNGEPEFDGDISQSHKRDIVLAKIAFSSGLAKSTKLAVLESQLRNYFEITKSMIDILSRGGRLRMGRSFVLSKTGQLLSIRAQLNLYSELTDSLPDLFWDSRSELGLEGYYDQVGRALDTNIRVKELNEKVNYAQDIANVLREALSERHGTRLEWIVIILIAVEIMFNILHEYRYYSKKQVEDAEKI